MKSLQVTQHEYITVSAINGTCRLNMTTSYGGAKASVSVKPSDPNHDSFVAAYKANIPVLRKLMNAGFCKLSPVGQEKTNGNGAAALKLMVENSKDHTELFVKLSAALA